MCNWSALNETHMTLAADSIALHLTRSNIFLFLFLSQLYCIEIRETSRSTTNCRDKNVMSMFELAERIKID